MLNQIVKFSLGLALLLGLALTSCNKEDAVISDNFEEDFVLEYRGGDGTAPGELGKGDHRPGILARHCFKLAGEVTVSFPDGSEATAADAAELKALLKDWKENNPDSDERPKLIFPYDVMLRDSTIVTVGSIDEVKALLKDCASDRPHRPKRKCFKPQFPLTIEFPDDTTVLVNNRAEMKAAIRDWKENNPDVDERPTIAFPFDVKLADGSIVTVNNEQDIQDLIDACHDG